MNGIRRFEDFDAWKLSVELRDLIYRVTESGTVLNDGRFRDQIRDAASSAPRNIAEGFGRFVPKDFANFTRMAKASLMETQNHLMHGLEEKYFSKADYERAWRLSKRALGATRGLHNYLRSCKGRLPWDPRNKQRGSTELPEPEPREPEPREPREPEPREPREPREPEPRKPEPRNPNPGNPNRRNPNPGNPNRRNPNPENPKNPEPQEPKEPGTPGTPSRP
jgi:four helix bundle protein